MGARDDRNSVSWNAKIDDIHEQAIALWIHSKTMDADLNPAAGIFFALTDEPWPPEEPEARDAITLCSVLNRAFGLPPLTEEEEKTLSARAFMLFREHGKGRSPIQYMLYLKWANRLGYTAGLVSVLVSGLSWWVLGLMFLVFWCFGAARTAAAMAKQGPRPAWEVPLIGAMHLIALLGLFVVSVIHFVR